MRKETVIAISILFTILASSAARGEIAVIGHRTGSTDRLTLEQVKSIYLKKSRALPGGTPVVPGEQPEESPLRSEFREKVLGKKASQLKAYWAKRIFTGQAVPPEVVGSNDDEVIRWVSGGAGRLGYVAGDHVTPEVKVLLRLP